MIWNSSEAVDAFGHSESNRFERFHGAPSSAKSATAGPVRKRTLWVRRTTATVEAGLIKVPSV